MTQNRVRSLLKHARAGGESSDEKARQLAELAERLGLLAQVRRSGALRPINAKDIHLIAWTAVQPAHPQSHARRAGE